MKLKIITNKKKDKPAAIIGKTGVIRFNKNYSFDMGIIRGGLWSIAIDEEEKIIKSIYLLKAANKINNIKIQIINNRISIDVKKVLDDFKIKYPNTFQVENFEFEKNKGLVLKLGNI